MPKKDVPSFSQGLSTEFLVGASAGADVDSIMQLYKSRSRMLEIIEDLSINVQVRLTCQ